MTKGKNSRVISTKLPDGQINSDCQKTCQAKINWNQKYFAFSE
jgi:hypothetical protein